MVIADQVSVIIPTYNRADRLMNSVRSVLNQSHRELELIIVDDGSTDDTDCIVAAISDSRVRYHRLERNGGAANARNIGVSLARYDIVAFNDSDDIWHPDKLEVQLKYWALHPEDTMVYCAYQINLIGGGIMQVPSPNEELDTLCGDIFYYLLLRPTIGTPTMITKRKTFEELGGFDITCAAMEDWEFSVRASCMGSIGYVDRPLITVEATAADRISNDSSFKAKMAHYETKCKVFARYINEIDKIGQFDLYAGEILKSAEKDGVLDNVKRMMGEYLKGNN